MRIIDIVFTKSAKKFPIGSWIILMYTGKEYSHVSRMTTLYDDVNLYYQANEGKTNYEYEKVFLTKHKIIKRYSLLLEDEIYKKISKECVKNAGKKYGIMQNIGIVVVDFLNLFGIKIDTPFKQGRNCSELIYDTVLKQIIPQLTYNKDIIKPHEIENIILTYFEQKDNLWIIKE